jgi:hypothetical protein
VSTLTIYKPSSFERKTVGTMSRWEQDDDEEVLVKKKPKLNSQPFEFKGWKGPSFNIDQQTIIKKPISLSLNIPSISTTNEITAVKKTTAISTAAMRASSSGTTAAVNTISAASISNSKIGAQKQKEEEDEDSSDDEDEYRSQLREILKCVNVKSADKYINDIVSAREKAHERKEHIAQSLSGEERIEFMVIASDLIENQYRSICDNLVDAQITLSNLDIEIQHLLKCVTKSNVAKLKKPKRKCTAMKAFSVFFVLSSYIVSIYMLNNNNNDYYCV